MHHKWQSYNVWFLRYEAWRTEFFVILDHFLSFYPPNNPKNENFEKMNKINWRYYHFTYVNHKSQSYDVWFLRYEAWPTKCFVILDRFLPFYPSLTAPPPNNLKNQNFEKLKKTPGDIIIFQMFTINDNHMTYSFWDIVFVILLWTIFFPFTPASPPLPRSTLIAQKIKVLKK